jgi:hypothetical protein
MASDFKRLMQWSIAFAFLVSALAGLVLRWDLVNAVATGACIGFADLRHAHSHIGFYGVLTLGWWLVSRQGAPSGPDNDLKLLSGRWVGLYTGAVFLTSALFVAMGYAAPTIVLSTLIVFFWALEAWRSRELSGWLSLAPWGVVLGLLPEAHGLDGPPKAHGGTAQPQIAATGTALTRSLSEKMRGPVCRTRPWTKRSPS